MQFTRRRFLALGATAGAIGVGGSLGRRVAAQLSARPLVTTRGDPFTLGVASGDPWPHSVVLWTRLVDDAGGDDDVTLEDRPYEVEWEIATDPAMAAVERDGTVWALPKVGHSVHLVVDGLRPGRDYWYRFRHGRWISPIARTKTAPAPGAHNERLDLAVASCQRWEDGYYTAHRHLAADAPDAVVFLGDYIYENGLTGATDGRRLQRPIPSHLATETDSLRRYRAQYAWYKRDPDLQAAHHCAPWIATWDDHEVQNNYAAAVAGDGTPTEAFAARRAAAYQAYWEHLPLRLKAPVASAMTLHRRLSFGSLARLHVLDTRQYRSDQIPGDAWQGASPAGDDPARTMLGRAQEQWLSRGLGGSTAAWNVVAQQVIAGRLRAAGSDGDAFNVDTWDGYPAAQRRLHDALVTTTNPIVLTGDLHAGYALDITAPLDDPAAPAIAVEFAATSISSGGDGSDLSASGRRLLAGNPQLHFASQRRGYLRCRLTRAAMTVDFRTVPYVTVVPDAPVTTAETFVVESGVPAIRAA